MPTVAELGAAAPAPGQRPTTGPYAGLSANDIIQQMMRTGFTQEGVNTVYAMRGLGQAPTIPPGTEGMRRGSGRDVAFYGPDGKPVKGGAAAPFSSFLHDFTSTAVDPYRHYDVGNWLGVAGMVVGGAMAGGAAAGGGSAGGGGAGAAGGAGGGGSGSGLGIFANGGAGGMAGVGGGNAGALAASGGIAGGAGVGGTTAGALGGASGLANSVSGVGGSGGGMGTTGGSGSWVDTLIDVGGDLAGSYLAGDAAHDAGRTQAAAAATAIAEQRRQYDQNREDLAPYRTAGSTAIGQLSAGTVNGGDFNRDFTLDDFVKDPGYQFRMNEGSRALQGANAATLGVQNGRTMRELTRYGQDYGSGEYSNAYNRFNADRNTRFNRLATIAGVGQTATNTGVAAGTANSNSVADLTLDRANAQAAGRVGQANAYGQGLESLANYYRTRKYGSPNTNWIGG
jgi:hypothetical protein